jgi:hypothetical protein
MFAPKYVGISQEYIRDNPGYVLFSGVENVRPQISLGFPKDMLGIFHFKITHRHVKITHKHVTTPNGSSRSTKWQMAHNERIIQGLLNEISGIEVLCRENTYLVIGLKT